MAELNRTNIQHMDNVLFGTFSSPILQTRLHIPPSRVKLVQRPRLFLSIEQALERRLLLLSAPAGYGKTTLLSAWAHQSSWPVAWFSLNVADNDQTRFLTYLINALRHIEGQVGKITLDLLTSQQVQSTEMLLTSLINELLYVPRMVLVLDDYHLIEEPHIHEGLAFLLEYLPENLHLIIATRTDPPLPLARLRARYQLGEMRTSDLRFRLEESTTFLRECMDLPLPEETIITLDERNQGWITGLQLAALSLQEHPEQSIQNLTGIYHFVFDYLGEEVMQHLSTSLQEFLLKTSILTHLQPSLCEAVTGQKSSEHQLALLEKSNLFLTPLDTEHTWYHYHPLFAGFLQRQLSQCTPELIPSLLTRASLWYEQRGYLDEAIQYALAAKQYPHAGRLIAQHARTLLVKRELSTLLRWIETLPADIIQTQPQLCIAYCWALFLTFQSERIGPLLQQAQIVLNATSDSENKGMQQLRGEIAAIQAMQSSLKGDLQQTLARSQEALVWLSGEDLWIRGTLVFFQGVAYYVTGDMLKAQRSYQEAVSLNRSAGNTSLSLLAHCYLARLFVTTGRLQDALLIHGTARVEAEQHNSHFSLAGGVLAVELGNIYYEQNEMESAYTALSRSIAIGKTLASTDILRAAYSVLARWQQARGQVEEVRSLLWQIDQMKQPASVLWVEAEIQAFQLQWRSTYETATECTHAEQEIEVSPISVLTEITYLAQARVLIAAAHYDVALSLLEKLLQHAEDEQRTGSIIRIIVLQGKASSARGDLVHALKTIQRALSLAAPERYMRVFIDEGQPIKAILQHAATHDIQTSYVMQLLHAFPEVVSNTQHTQLLLDPLSERELEVLQCIMQGQSNQTIANHLQVSLNTIKTHMSHIFAKLHVNSRTQAVARANELQLIPGKHLT